MATFIEQKILQFLLSIYVSYILNTKHSCRIETINIRDRLKSCLADTAGQPLACLRPVQNFYLYSWGPRKKSREKKLISLGSLRRTIIHWGHFGHAHRYVSGPPVICLGLLWPRSSGFVSVALDCKKYKRSMSILRPNKFPRLENYLGAW